MLVAASCGLCGTGPVLVAAVQVVATSLRTTLGLRSVLVSCFALGAGAIGPSGEDEGGTVTASSGSAVPTPRALSGLLGTRWGPAPASPVPAALVAAALDGPGPGRSLALGMGEVAACTVRAGTFSGEVALDTGPRGVGAGSVTARISIEYSILSTEGKETQNT